MPSTNLTRREREVSLLVAEGLSNREIAQRLFISERTAESHVEQIRGKLAFRSRAQIAAWVAGGGLEGAGARPAAPPAGRRRGRRESVVFLIGAVAVISLVGAALVVRAPSGPTPVAATLTVVAGTGARSFSDDDRPAIRSPLMRPLAIAVSRTGDLYLTDGNRIRVVSPDGVIRTLAGTGSAGSAGDGGPASAAELNGPQGVAVDNAGDIFIADTLGNRVRKVDASRRISTVAGTGAPGYSGDGGPAKNAGLNLPTALAVGVGGALLIADTGNNVVREVAPDGSIHTIAGTGEPAYRGDGGPAAYAALRAPGGLAVDGEGNLFVADTLNQRIRRVDVNGQIATVAGTGIAGFSGDRGPAVYAELNLAGNPFEGIGQGLAAGPRGDVFVADAENHRVRRIDVSGRITTVAEVRRPLGLGVDASGTIYVADGDANQVIRVG